MKSGTMQWGHKERKAIDSTYESETPNESHGDARGGTQNGDGRDTTQNPSTTEMMGCICGATPVGE